MPDGDDGDEQGAEASFAGFVRSRWTPLVRLAYALTGDVARAEDVVQDALAKLWPRWTRLRDENPDGYARRMVVNQAVSAGRPRWRRREVLTDRLPDRAAPGAGAQRFEQREVLRQALAALPPRQRAVVVLRVVEDLSEAQVAQILGCSIGSVKAHTSRGLAALRAAHATHPALLDLEEIP